VKFMELYKGGTSYTNLEASGMGVLHTCNMDCVMSVCSFMTGGVSVMLKVCSIIKETRSEFDSALDVQILMFSSTSRKCYLFHINMGPEIPRLETKIK
jgi:hypothetical protein